MHETDSEQEQVLVDTVVSGGYSGDTIFVNYETESWGVGTLYCLYNALHSSIVQIIKWVSVLTAMSDCDVRCRCL